MPPGVREGYPWDEWLDGRVWHLTRGEDFTTSPRNFSSSVRQAAARKGVKLSTRVLGDNVFIQANLEGR